MYNNIDEQEIHYNFRSCALASRGGYWYWQSQEGSKHARAKRPEESAEEGLNAITDNVSQGVLPSLDVNTNPLSQSPDVNPSPKQIPSRD